MFIRVVSARYDPGQFEELRRGIVKLRSSPARRGEEVGNIPHEAAQIGGQIPSDRLIRAQSGVGFGGQNLT